LLIENTAAIFGFFNQQSKISNQQFPPLPYDEHFPHVIAGEKEFNGGEIAEEGFDVAVVKDALQAKAVADRGMDSSSRSAARFAA
jgi:hypothetical protein